jgi:hypothetical protein
MVLESPEGTRSGNDLRELADHARRVRSLMRYVPRRYDPGLIEALALNGALDPARPEAERAQAIARAAAFLQGSDQDSTWTGEIGADGGLCPPPAGGAASRITMSSITSSSPRRSAQAPRPRPGAGRRLREASRCWWTAHG